MVAFLVLVFYLVISICAAVGFDRIAVMKGQPERKYFWWCFWFSVAGWFMVIALPDRGCKKPIVDVDELPDL